MRRREFLLGGSGLLAGTLLPGPAAADPPPLVLRLQDLPAAGGTVMPSDFLGLSYESAQLQNPAFFSAGNTALVAQFQLLGEAGVLRLGGNLGDFTLWSAPDAPAASSQETVGAERAQPYFEWKLVDAGAAHDRRAVITPEALRQLRGFLDATGWRLLYGLNFGTGTPQRAADEAAWVQQLIGPRLIAFQLGNEVDFYGGGHRPKPWEFDQYWSDYRRFVAAVRQRTPEARFAGPDAAVRMDWVCEYARRAKNDAVLLSSHYYAMGPAEDPRMNAQRLLQPDPRLQQLLAQATEASALAGVPYRMTEANSCFHGGRPGVSDAFASALWGADFMLQLAQAGCAGVNLHGGGEGIYAAIVGDRQRGFVTRPLYQAMQFMRPLAGCRLQPAALRSARLNVAAYAAEGSGSHWLAVINKEPRPLQLSLQDTALGRLKLRTIQRLEAPALGSPQASLSMVQVAEDSAGTSLDVRAYSAMLARFG